MRVILLGAICALAACATPTAYQRAETANQPGFSETRIEDDRFRVSFTAGPDATQQDARDYALRRAAELTLQHGYDWFEVTDRGLEPAREPDGPRFSIGLGGADYGRTSSVGAGVGVTFGGGGGTGPGSVATLEIVMGADDAPEGPDVYDARAVASSLAGR